MDNMTTQTSENSLKTSQLEGAADRVLKLNEYFPAWEKRMANWRPSLSNHARQRT